MAKFLSDSQQEAQRQKEAEAGLKNLLKKAELPPTPQAPVGLTGQAKDIWQLQQDVSMLKARYDLGVKILWRTSAALVGLAAPLIGWDWIARIVAILGGQ